QLVVLIARMRRPELETGSGAFVALSIRPTSAAANSPLVVPALGTGRPTGRCFSTSGRTMWVYVQSGRASRSYLPSNWPGPKIGTGPPHLDTRTAGWPLCGALAGDARR